MTKTSDLLSEWIKTAERLSSQDQDNRIRFWGRELAKTWSFLIDHEDVYMAWLQENSRLANTPATPSHRQPLPESSTGLRELIEAGVGYFEYVQRKLDQLRCLPPQNSYFLRA